MAFNFFSFRIAIIIFALMFANASVYGQPAQNQIEAYISSFVPNIVSVRDLKFKNFQDRSAGVGRTSVSGSFEFKKDVFVEDKNYSKNVIIEELRRNKLSDSDIRNYYGGKADEGYYPLILKQTYKKGDTFPFRGELIYLETVDGFKFSGKVVHDINIGSGSVVIDDFESYQKDLEKNLKRYVRRISITKSVYEEIYRRQKREIVNTLINKKFLIQTASLYKKPLVFRDRAVVMSGNKIIWKKREIRNSPASDLLCEIPVTVEWLDDWAGSVSGTSFKKGAIVDLNIQCAMLNRNDKAQFYFKIVGTDHSFSNNAIVSFRDQWGEVFVDSKYRRLVEKPK